MKKDLFVIVDGNALLHRAWHAIPQLRTTKGELINVVYGFTTILLKALKTIKPAYAAVTFDRPGKTFRHLQYAEYKGTREKKPDEFYHQFDRVKEVVRAFHIPLFEKDGFEADDVIATLCTRSLKDDPKLHIAIITGDMDALQLVGERVSVHTLKKGIGDLAVYDVAAVHELFGGLSPEQLVQYKALRGDQSDNIKGVPGIGEKTALALIRHFGTLDRLYAAVEEAVKTKAPTPLLSEKLIEKLTAHHEDAIMSLALVKMVHDVPLDFSLSACRMDAVDHTALMKLFQELEFKSLIPRLKEVPGFQDIPSYSAAPHPSDDTGKRYVLLRGADEIRDFLKKLSAQHIFAFDTESTSINAFEAQLVGMSFCFEEGVAYYISYLEGSAQWKQNLKEILENPAIKKIGHNSKYDIEVLLGSGIALQGAAFDTMIAAYLLNPGVREYGLDALSFSEFGYQKIPITALIGEGKKQRSMAEVPLEEITPYACEDADFTWRLYERYRTALKEQEQEKLFFDIEIPLLEVLIAMESAGVSVDSGCLKNLSKKVNLQLKDVSDTITTLAGEEFNINSPVQLKKILFEKLNISSTRIRKGKTGLSTAASELEKMKNLHPIIPAIMEYRELAKLQNTYIDVLPTLLNPRDHRIHTSFNQTIAATGRLSSSNPNLQNIPIRQELGNEIRKCFVAEKGYVLLGADYSQMELRIIASLADDVKMIKAFRDGKDIHTTTAAEIHGIPLEDVAPQMRRAAKEINFGILYGMGPQGLSQSAGISYAEAESFIDRYFAAYPAVRDFLDGIVSKAKTTGYVETLFGRRRYMPELSSSNVQVRNAAMRMATNMPVQGTAADIMKIAMIRVFEKIKKRIPHDARMILQVHDELLFEVRPQHIKEIAAEVRKEMEAAWKLAVPLAVDIKTGPNWGEMKPL